MASNFDFNGTVPKDKIYSNLTVQCRNICGREIGLPPQDFICNRAFVQGVLNQCSGEQSSNPNEPTDPQYDAYRQALMRIHTALTKICDAKNTVWETNGDEEMVLNFRAMFAKTMPHNMNGTVVVSAYAMYRTALNTRDIVSFSNIPLGSVMPNIQFKEPLVGITLNPVGPAPSTIEALPCPSMTSQEAAGEMVEDYCLALSRDVPFANYAIDATIASCVGYLSVLPAFSSVNSTTIFRGISAGDTIGPYLSQLLWNDCPYWPNSISARSLYPMHVTTNNRMLDAASYLSCQNGLYTESNPVLQVVPTYISCGRDLAHYVWRDLPGQFGECAARIALSQGAQFSPLNPYIASSLLQNQCAFPTWSLSDICACLHPCGQLALTCAWYSKWFSHRRLRPEAFANEIEQVRLTASNPTNIHPDLLTSAVLPAIGILNGAGPPVNNYYLSQTYPEGSPAHPSYPSGHATFAGACATIIKAFLDENFIFPTPVEANAAGTLLNPYVGPPLTLGNELNKMAFNIGCGRNWAGVHYRSDITNGILLGEQVAISFLQDWIERYPEPNAAFSFHGYLGNLINIRPQTSYGTDVQNNGSLPNFIPPNCCT